MRLGILGGTFDPIHFGHLFIAEEARARLRLDRVLFVPNAVSPFKTKQAVSATSHRYEMTRLAIQGNEAFEASRLEIDRPGPSYTVDTLRSLNAEHPDAELFFITGADAVADFELWRETSEVQRLARIVAVTRPGFPFEAIERRLSGSARERIDMLETVEIHVSGTELRRRVRDGLPIRYLTPDAVVDYIERNGLYRSER